MSILIKVLRHLAVKHNKFNAIYLKLAKLSSAEYASYLKEINYFYSIGDNCLINKGMNATDPKLVKIGNKVTLSHCTLLCHDGVIGILNNLYDSKFDSVGKIEIGDNSFIGHGAIVMPNTVIGSSSVVAAGAVVTKDVASGDVVGGIPAKKIGTIDDLAKKAKQKTDEYPWADLIHKRNGVLDLDLEPTLLKMRQEHFFKNVNLSEKGQVL